jgi:hypothetical protein
MHGVETSRRLPAMAGIREQQIILNLFHFSRGIAACIVAVSRVHGRPAASGPKESRGKRNIFTSLIYRSRHSSRITLQIFYTQWQRSTGHIST